MDQILCDKQYCEEPIFDKYLPADILLTGEWKRRHDGENPKGNKEIWESREVS